jgi:putative nucleotidyltransferase with HDIG domain
MEANTITILRELWMICFKDVDFHLFVESLIRTIELKDIYTAGHSRRVSEIAELMCRGLDMPPGHCEYIHVIGHLHDIGKIGIAEGILMKSGKLSNAEYFLMQQHSVIGASIFENLPGLENMAKIIRHHHERFDGKGYPDKLKGADIPLESAIIAIADSFDAMTSFRPYKPTLSQEQAILEIEVNKGKQFHPDLCDLFIGIYRDNRELLSGITEDRVVLDSNPYVPFSSTRSGSTSLETCN